MATVPVIACGGAGTLAHFAPAVDAGADAVLAASVFHFGTLRIGPESKDRPCAALSHPYAEGEPPQPGRERDLLRCDERGAHLQLDLGVRGERDVPRVTLEDLAVVDRHHVPASRANLGGAERLPPLVEEVAQRVGPVHRGLDVDDAVSSVRVQPVEAGPLFDERADRGGLGYRTRDADGGRDLPGRAVHEDGQVGVDVEQGLLA